MLDPVLVFLDILLPATLLRSTSMFLRLEKLVSPLERSTLRMRLQMRARESWNCEFSKVARTAGAAATTGESERNTGLLEVIESDFPPLPNSLDSSNSCLGSSTSACARLSRAAGAFASARVCPFASSSAEFAAVVHAHASILHGARNSGGTGGLLPVQRSTSYCLDNSWSDTGRFKGPTGRRGFPVRPKICAPSQRWRQGYIFGQLAVYGGRLQVHFPGRQPATGTRRVRGGAVTPSSHSDVLDTEFVSPGRRLGIRQSMGWTKVCQTALSGIWVLKG